MFDISFRLTASVALVLLLVAACVAEEHRYYVSEGDSTVRFTISKWTVFKEEGRFLDYEGVIDYDPKRPEATEVRFTVHVESIDTKKEKRDETLLSEDFFYAKKYPTMDFVSVHVAPAEDGELHVTGDLTIRGVTQRITVPVAVLGVTEVDDPPAWIVGFETTFVIDRTDFGVLGEQWSGGELILGHDVTLHLIVSASTRP